MLSSITCLTCSLFTFFLTYILLKFMNATHILLSNYYYNIYHLLPNKQCWILKYSTADNCLQIAWQFLMRHEGLSSMTLRTGWFGRKEVPCIWCIMYIYEMQAKIALFHKKKILCSIGKYAQSHLRGGT